MKPLKDLCIPRDSVFDIARRDTVLNLTHLTAEKISAKDFFEENYVTEGMKTLLTEAFRRLQKKFEQAVFKLTQAMGGGKTHNLITLGMLARHPEFRGQVLKDLPDAKALPPVRVVAFSGRETDVPHGIWGEIARQLGKQDAFKDYYSPLKAPGRTAWINLLKGEPTLILLDELPPYLDNAKSVAVGNSDLAKVTATALTNLFEAVAENELGNVCVVLTDLVGTYAEASAQIGVVLQQLQNEAQRHSMNLTPVQINTDEFYHILRKRLFKTLPKDAQVDEVAQAYAKAVREAKQMDITAQSPEQFAQLVKSSYPFHPAIKDFYARFRENQGFQQTRALIRLIRIIASRLWQSGEAATKHLISVHDIDLNEPETLSEIRQINPSLENAVSHDIAAQGKAVAEAMDQNLGGTDARDVCRLMFVASLANVPNAVLGLPIPELVGQGLNAQLKQFFDQTTFKNRVAVLTGSRNTFDSLVDRLKRPDAKASGVRISVTGDRWAELNLHELLELDAAQLGEAVEAIRKLPVTGNGQVEVSAGTIHFPTGQRLLDWLNETKTDVRPGEVKQG